MIRAFVLLLLLSISLSSYAQPPVFREVDMDGQAWTDTNYENLRQWIQRRNQRIVDDRAVESAKRLKADVPTLAENPPTGVVVENIPHINGNWYGGAPVEKVTAEAIGDTKTRSYCLTLLGPGAPEKLATMRADSRFQSAAQPYGSTLHLQAYADLKEAEAIAPGITSGGSAIVFSVIEKDSPLDGKVLWRPRAEPSIEEVVAQLRDKARPDYDPTKDPGGLGGGIDFEALKQSRAVQLGAVFLGILAISRLRR